MKTTFLTRGTAAALMLFASWRVAWSQSDCLGPAEGLRPGILYFPHSGFKQKCGFPEFTTPTPAKPKWYLKEMTAVHQDSGYTNRGTCPFETRAAYGGGGCVSTTQAGAVTKIDLDNADVHRSELFDKWSGTSVTTYSGARTRRYRYDNPRLQTYGWNCPPLYYVNSELTDIPTYTSQLAANGTWSGTGTKTRTINAACNLPSGWPACLPGTDPTTVLTRSETSVENAPWGFPGFLTYFSYQTTGPTTQSGSVMGNFTDCNNALIFPPWHQTGTTTRSLEFTTPDLDTIARQLATASAAELADPRNWGPVGTARYALSADEFTCKVRKLSYQFGFPAEAGVAYTVTWSTVIIGENGTFTEHSGHTWTGLAGADGWVKSPEFLLDPPSYNCVGYVAHAWATPALALTAASSASGCCGGARGQLGRSAGKAAEGPSYSLSLGQEGFQKASGTLRYSAGRTGSDRIQPGRLSLIGKSAATDVVAEVVTGAIRQVKTTQMLADVQTVSAASFRVDLYAATTVPPKGSNGLYPVTGLTPFESWTATAPDAGSGQFNRVLITQTTGASSLTTYEYLENAGVWTLNYPGNLAREKSWQTWAQNQLTQVTEQWDPLANRLQRRSEVTYEVAGLAPGLVEDWLAAEDHVGSQTPLVKTREADGLPGQLRETRYDYIPGYTGDQLLGSTSPGGRWQKFTYENYTVPGKPSIRRIKTVTEGFGDSVSETDPNVPVADRQTTYGYEPAHASDGGRNFRPTVPRTTTVAVNATVVSKTARVLQKTAGGLLATTTDYQLSAAVEDPATDLNALKTVTTHFTTGPFASKVQKVDRPDGTRTVYAYSETATLRTTRVATGPAHPTDPLKVMAGTLSVSEVRPSGQLISQRTENISPVAALNGLILNQETYSQFDSLDRPQQVTHGDGTADYTYYACCGLDYTVDRDGVTTQFLYDAAKRSTGTLRLGIKTENRLDAAGNVIRTERTGSDHTVMVLSAGTYLPDGTLETTTDAANSVTKYTKDYSSGYLLSTTQEAFGTPDESTRVERYARDGQLVETSGTGTAPLRFERGYVDLDGGYRPYTKTIKLTEPGTQTGIKEWTMTVLDFMGRPYKTLYADSTPEDLTDNPASLSFYDPATGRLQRQVDADGVVTLFSRPVWNENVVAVDLNQNGVIDYAGPDRVTKTASEVATEYGTTTRRNTTYEYKLSGLNTATVISASSASVNGLKSWTTTAGLANPTTTETTLLGGGARQVRHTNPDGSYSLAAYQNGRLLSETAYSSAGVQISKQTMTYDAHGRTWKVADARNGTTTYTYDSADRVSVVTTPAPGTGLAAQTVSTIYDALGRAKEVIQPDGTAVFQSYFPTGALKKTWGSRTYPTEYTYDSQGRRKTLKTWRQSAANATAAVTTWNYHPYRGWLDNQRYADNLGPDFEYTVGGRLKKRKWARTGIGGNRIETVWTYGFDDPAFGNDHDQVVGIRFNWDPQSTPAVTSSHDRCGHPTTATRNGITTTRTYTATGEPLLESSAGGLLAGLAVEVGYDFNLRRNTVTSKKGSSVFGSSSYGYDSAGRLLTVTSGSSIATYGYLGNSSLAGSVHFADNGSSHLNTTRSYDYLNRLVSLSSVPSAAGQAPLTYSYGYNDAGQRITLQMPDGSSWRYQYDALGQLSVGRRFWDDGSAVAGQQFEFAFDHLGNRTKTASGGDALGTGLRLADYTLSPNGLNQYLTRTVPAFADIIGAARAPVAPTVDNLPVDARKNEYFWKQISVPNGPVLRNVIVNVPGGTAQTGAILQPPAQQIFNYDADGNLLNDGLWVYTWDAENRLVAMENVTTLAAPARRRLTFEYDDRSRRIGKKVYAWTGASYATLPTTSLKYLYEGWNLIAELNDANLPIRTYTWGNDLSGRPQGAGGVGGLLKVTSYTYPPTGPSPIVTPLFAVYDGNGNVTGLVDANTGIVAANYEYGPFGERLRASGPQARSNPLRFSTKYQDDETELSYYGYRFYSTSLGRWINRDPSEEQPGDSLYSFVGNKPISSFDFLGLYEGDFHFYVIYYLLRAKGFSHSVAYDIAFGSQEIDDNPLTSPLELGKRVVLHNRGGILALQMLVGIHFSGSGPNTPTTAAESSALENAQAAMSQWITGSSRDAFGAGRLLHTLADTWSHDGFTAYENRRFNGIQTHTSFGKEQNPYYVSKGVIGYVGHTMFDTLPDQPIYRRGPALSAARTIYSIIPNQSCNPLPWSTIEKDLVRQFGVGSYDQYPRRIAASIMIQSRFQDSFNTWYISPWPESPIYQKPENPDF